MAILDQLGLNQTVFFQLLIFLVTITVLSTVAISPYLAALKQRELRTVGGEAQTAEIQKKSADLQSKYETAARKINDEIRTIYDSFREQANQESEKIVSAARIESNSKMEKVRSQITLEIGEATKKAKEQAPELAQKILQKLLAKSTGASV